MIDSIKRSVKLLFIKKNKKGIEMEMLGWAIISLFILVIMLLGYMMLKQKGIGAIEYIKNLFRFGR